MSSTLLFNKVLLVLKIQDGDKRKCDVLFTIEEVMHNIKKEVNLRLTDDSDQFFLYQLKITEEDFHHLKAQQGLLIDFRAFPQKVIQMLEDCSSRDANRLSLVFTISGFGGLHSVGVLSIVETNEFKQLDHLRLEFHPGTDTEIKNYLLKNLKDTKNKLDTMTTSLNTVQYDIQQYKEALTSKTIETSEVRNACDERVREIERINDQKLSDIQHRHADAMKSVEEKYLSSMKRLEQKLSDATETVKVLKETKHRQESQIADLKSNLSAWDEERGNIQSEATKLRRDNSSLQSRLSEKEFQLADTMSRLSMLEKELASKDETLKKEHNLLSTERESNRKLEEDLIVTRNEMTKTKEKLGKVVEKLTAMHNENNRLKKEHEQQQSKLDRRTTVSGRQEQHIRNLEKNVADLNNTIEKLEAEKLLTMQQFKVVEHENVKLRADLEDGRRILKENEQLISWLTKQVHESPVHHSRDSNQTGRVNFFNQSIPFSGSTNRNMGHSVEGRNNNNNIESRREEFLDPKFLCNTIEESRAELGKPLSPSLHPSKQQQPSPNSVNPTGRHPVHSKNNPTSKPSRDAPVAPQPAPNPLTTLRGVTIGNMKNISPRNAQNKPPPLVSSYFQPQNPS